MSNGNKPIASNTTSVKTGEFDHLTETTVSGGLTKREYFAGLAMQGMLNNAPLYPEDMEIESICVIAVLYADQLLKELDK